MQFNYNGVRLPLPVNLHVRDMTFSNTLRLIEAQTAESNNPSISGLVTGQLHAAGEPEK